MQKLKLIVLGASAAGLLAACGDNMAEQTLFGGAAGALAAEALGGSVTTGVLVGAAGNVLFCKENPGKC